MNKLKNVEYMLQFITHKNDRYGYVEGAIEALAGGCKWIQLRMKEATADELREAVKILKPACAEKEAILVIDDHVELVAELDVDGVHLGKNDMPPAEARRLLGEKYIIGATANTIEDIRALAVQDVDYIVRPLPLYRDETQFEPCAGCRRLSSHYGGMQSRGY